MESFQRPQVRAADPLGHLSPLFGRPGESWPFLSLPFNERQSFNQAYKTWNPTEFDADAWMNLCEESGLKMFAFTTKHHEGFSLFDTRTRVRNRVHWTAPEGPKIEDCDFWRTASWRRPLRRDVVRELTAAAHKRNIKIDLYFSHSDWYDADFRPYGMASSPGSVVGAALGAGRAPSKTS